MGDDLTPIKLHNDELLLAALEYAELGFPVFPCAPMSKQPATGHGFKDATTDLDQIRKWWTHCPWFNIGIPTAGYLVLDYDDPNPGNWPEGWPMMDMPEHPFYHCPNDGSHSWLTALPGTDWRNTTKKLAPNIDTRANGGYCVVPPSICPEGLWRWPIASLKMYVPPLTPQWLATKVTAQQLNGDQTLEREFLQSDRPIPDGQRNQTLTQIGGWLRRHGFSQDEIITLLVATNMHRCKPPLGQRELEKIAGSVARYEPDLIAVGAMEGVDLEPVEPPVRQYQDPGPFPDRLVFSIPGLCEEIITHTLRTAPRQQPVLALAGALSLMSTITGRKIADESNLRTNLLILAVAPSASGKDWPRRVNTQILLETGCDSMLGSEEVASAQGIYTTVRTNPAVLLQLDEIGKMLATTTAQGSAHMRNVPVVLMKIYSGSGGLMKLGGYVDPKRNFEVNQPHLTVFGTTVVESLANALTPEQLTDGFISRLLFFMTENRPDHVEPVHRALAASILDEVTLWRQFYEDRGNLMPENPDPRALKYKSDAASVLKEYRKSCDKQTDHPEMWGRNYEKAKKLAMDYQASEDGPGVQEIGVKAIEWGIEVSDWSTRKLLSMADDYVAEDAREQFFNKIERWCRKTGTFTQGDFTRRWRKRPARERAEILAELTTSGHLGKKVVGHGTTEYWWRAG